MKELKGLIETVKSLYNEDKQVLSEATTMLSEGLNSQYNYELRSTLVYEQLANQASFLGYKGASAYFHHAAKEELEHAHKFAELLQDLNTLPNVQTNMFESISTPKGFVELIQAALIHEKTISARIKQLLKSSKELDDYNTEDFLLSFVKEQVEEESKLEDILDRINSFNSTDKTSLLIIDQELKEQAQ